MTFHVLGRYRYCAARLIPLALFLCLLGCTTLGYRTASTSKDGATQSRDVHVTTTKPASEIMEMVKGGVGSAVDFLGPTLTSLIGGGAGVGALVGWLNSRASKSRDKVRKEYDDYIAGLNEGLAGRSGSGGAVPTDTNPARA